MVRISRAKLRKKPKFLDNRKKKKTKIGAQQQECSSKNWNNDTKHPATKTTFAFTNEII